MPAQPADCRAVADVQRRAPQALQPCSPRRAPIVARRLKYQAMNERPNSKAMLETHSTATPMPDPLDHSWGGSTCNAGHVIVAARDGDRPHLQRAALQPHREHALHPPRLRAGICRTLCRAALSAMSAATVAAAASWAAGTGWGR